MGKPLLRCYKCGAIYHYQLRREWVLRKVFFFIPVKVYFCAKCAKKRHLLLNDKKAAEYEAV